MYPPISRMRMSFRGLCCNGDLVRPEAVSICDSRPIEVYIYNICTARHQVTGASTGGEGAEVVLDHVGGQTFAACLSAARVDGAVINIGRLDTAAATIDLDALSYRHLRVQGVSFGFTRAAELGSVIAAAGRDLLPAVAGGRVRPVVDGTYSFGTAAEAAERLRSHRANGKLVLTVP
jgi:NADPH2:quinone reductase